jgi:hypothetical protein
MSGLKGFPCGFSAEIMANVLLEGSSPVKAPKAWEEKLWILSTKVPILEIWFGYVGCLSFPIAGKANRQNFRKNIVLCKKIPSKILWSVKSAKCFLG